MTETTIVITYWYNKQFTITTDVIEHTEVNKDGKPNLVKGGEVSGEDALPYETVLRGQSNTLEIKMKPDDGYRVKEIKINNKSLNYSNDENVVIDGNIITLPEGYLSNIQEDKKITVEYEKIPAKVIIKYLDEETEQTIYKTEDGKEYDEIIGVIDDEYSTEERNFAYYEFVKEKYPENAKGTMTKEDIVVKYYYRKLKFNMKVEKEIDGIILNGVQQEIENTDKTKIEIDYNDINKTQLEIRYRIKVTNTEKVDGIAIIEEQLPEGFEFVKEKSSPEWEEKDGKYILKTSVIKSGDTNEYLILLRWNVSSNNVGEKVNNVNIVETSNVPNYNETTTQDNQDFATVEIKVNKKVTDRIKEITREIKTGDSILLSVVSLMLATGVLVVIKKYNK